MLLVLSGGRLVATAAAAGVISVVAVAVALWNLGVELPFWPTMAVQVFVSFMLGMALMMLAFFIIIWTHSRNR